MAWKSIKNMLSRDHTDSGGHDDDMAAPSSYPTAREKAAVPRKALALDAIGQRDETVRQRISMMAHRLDELQSLQDEFNGIVEPIVHISDELSRASRRIAELENSLAQQSQALAAARQEAAEAADRLVELTAGLSDATSLLERTEGELREAQATVEEQRETLRARVVTIENLERQLFAETEQKSALLGENKALRNEVQAADTALTEAEYDARSARERAESFSDENRRLQLLAEEQTVQVAALRARLDEVETRWEGDRQRLRQVEQQLAAEKTERERLQTQYDTESSFHRNDRAGLSAKLEAANVRMASIEQSLTHAHRQLREKDEAVRGSERSLKEAMIARSTAERRVETLQADLERQRERFMDMQQERSELSSRAEMLTKALAAKDLTIEQVNARNHALAERIEQLNAKHEATRNELETTVRRLSEDLENERSERLLAQGALDIARESRAALQKQHDALKRAGRDWREAGRASHSDGDPEESNVRPFSSRPKSES